MKGITLLISCVVVATLPASQDARSGSTSAVRCQLDARVSSFDNGGLPLIQTLFEIARIFDSTW
jgi:hypothetical protein